MKPLLAISQGDAVGVGPEVTLKALSTPGILDELHAVVFGDLGVLQRAARELGLALRLHPLERAAEARGLPPGAVGVVSCSKLDASALRWGQPGEVTDRAQLAAIRGAFAAVRAGEAAAIVTGPIRKTALDHEGRPFPGHTELLAYWCAHPRSFEAGQATEDPSDPSLLPVMMLAGPHLKVIPLTTHLALSEVPAQLSEGLILQTLQITQAAFQRYFSRPAPRIAVAGLNPHAGEGGRFGDEEARIIAPALAQAAREGIQASGPWPADAVFNKAVDGAFDVVIGMYHDQALIPLKLIDFDRAVNVTLGLPIIRTSVDHGTAYDIAGQGRASAASMVEALRLAAEMARAAAAQGEACA